MNIWRLGSIFSHPLLRKEQQQNPISCGIDFSSFSPAGVFLSSLLLSVDFLGCWIKYSQILCFCLCLFFSKFYCVVVQQINNNNNCSYPVMKVCYIQSAYYIFSYDSCNSYDVISYLLNEDILINSQREHKLDSKQQNYEVRLICFGGLFEPSADGKHKALCDLV